LEHQLFYLLWSGPVPAGMAVGRRNKRLHGMRMMGRPVSEQQRSSSTARRRHRRQVTSVDVAGEAGVSQATVARVFASPHKVSSSTKAKVQAAADRLGYVPNAIARSLKSQRTNIIGAVVPAYGEYWQGVLTAFSRQLAEQGQQLLLFSFTDTDHVEQALAAVEQYRLDGLVMASATIGSRQLHRMGNRDLPLVAFNQPAASGIIPSVSVDNESGSRHLAEHLVEAGAADAVFVGGVAATSTDQLRYRGAAQAFGANGIACPYVAAGAFTYEAGYQAAGRLLARDTLPAAVMVAADELAFGVMDGLRGGGVSIPGEVMISGFDGLPQAGWAGYDLTTLVQDTGLLVQRAIEAMLQPPDPVTDQGRRTSPLDVVVAGTLRIGATTAPGPATTETATSPTSETAETSETSETSEIGSDHGRDS